jgi:pSer/pThr/pTyr-binding forkhead associated (FHA) protein
LATSPISPHLATPAELKERIEAERSGGPFVVYRDGQARQRIVPLRTGEPATIGRDPECAISIGWDSRVSRLHAEVSELGGHWIVADDGLSRNGTFVNGERISGRRRLHDRDQVELGGTVLVFRDPEREEFRSTELGRAETAPELSPAQHRVLVALCRPYLEGSAYARPATNRQIADDLHLSVAAVKTHLRLLFQRFGVEELAQNEKRGRLVQLAFDTGAVSASDLGAN